VHAGATHVLPQWLNCLAEGGRLVVPLTVSIPGMPDTISKGVVLTATRRGDRWPAHVGSMVAIYSLVGLRDATANQRTG
jgi:protein-L-isoaspartate O-methyltransferase